MFEVGSQNYFFFFFFSSWYPQHILLGSNRLRDEMNQKCLFYILTRTSNFLLFVTGKFKFLLVIDYSRSIQHCVFSVCYSTNCFKVLLTDPGHYPRQILLTVSSIKNQARKPWRVKRLLVGEKPLSQTPEVTINKINLLTHFVTLLNSKVLHDGTQKGIKC